MTVPERYQAPLVATALAAATLVVYAQVAGFGFVGADDGTYVRDNPRVSAGLTADGVRWAFTSFEASNWHPLTWLSLMLDAEIGGTDPRTFHVTNLVLHLANTLLLFRVLLSMSGRLRRSALVAALFAVHPLHVESVAWVAERKDVLSTLFGLLAILAHAAYARRGGSFRYGLVVVAFALGLMAKPMLVTLPLVLMLLDHWPLGRFRVRRVVVEKLPLLAMAAASCAVTLRAQSGALGSLEALSFGTRVVNAVTSYAWYLVKAFWPSGLAMPYPYDHEPSPWIVAGAGLLLLAISVAVARSARRAPYLAVGWLWYLGTLVPVIGLVQVGTQPMADRYTYVPLIGVFVMIVWGGADLLERADGRRRVSRRFAAVVALAIVVALTAAARAQARHWRDSEALFTRALEVTEANAFAHDGLGTALADRGLDDRAVEHYRKALRFDPGARYARRNLAAVLVRRGELDEAERLGRELLAVDPSSVIAHETLAVILMRKGSYEEAVGHYREVLGRRPDAVDSRAGYAVALTRLGRLDEAIEEFTAALRLDPDHVPALKGIAVALGRRGDFNTAIGHLERAVRLSPDDPDAHFNLATLLARVGRAAEAEAEFNEVLRLDPGHPRARESLGILLRRQGREALRRISGE